MFFRDFQRLQSPNMSGQLGQGMSNAVMNIPGQTPMIVQQPGIPVQQGMMNTQTVNAANMQGANVLQNTAARPPSISMNQTRSIQMTPLSQTVARTTQLSMGKAGAANMMYNSTVGGNVDQHFGTGQGNMLPGSFQARTMANNMVNPMNFGNANENQLVTGPGMVGAPDTLD